MSAEAPPFWWTAPSWQARVLAPAGWLYGRIAARRMDRARRHVLPVPVICVGNPTVGGSGKTPVALAIARAAARRGLKPGFLSRGHGGSLDRPTRVEPGRHRARDVGDEPLLLAAEAPTVIARNRLQGAELLVGGGTDLVIMDDGFQSAQLAFDEALLVVDARRGLGNGHLIPAGPLRAPLRDQLRHASALVVVGEGGAADGLVRQAARAAKPVHAAGLVPINGAAFAGHRLLAFAGIGDPHKFFRTLEELGAEPVERRVFGDHHPYGEDEAGALLDAAERGGLMLATTAKDIARLRGGHGRCDTLARRAAVLEVEARFESAAALDSIIEAALDRHRRRRLER